MLILADYQLRWWRLPIEERAYRRTRLGGCDYQFRTSLLPPPARRVAELPTAGSNLELSIIS